MKTSIIAVPENWESLEPHPLSALTQFGAGIDIDALADHMRNTAMTRTRRSFFTRE